MKIKYDFHIHSCLSPCGDNDMTPNNIVNMMSLLSCDAIAISDHNSCKNAPALMKIGKEVGVLVVPAMELTTSEEAHIVCLFDSLANAMKFDEYIYNSIPNIKNKPEIFGNQYIMDENDEIIKEEEKLLITATSISAEDVVELVESFGGVAFPAHVDKDSYSLIASLGYIPKEYNFNCLELSTKTKEENFFKEFPDLKNYKVLRNSDCHYLENFPDDFDEIEVEDLSLESIIKYFRNIKI